MPEPSVASERQAPRPHMPSASVPVDHAPFEVALEVLEAAPHASGLQRNDETLLSEARTSARWSARSWVALDP